MAWKASKWGLSWPFADNGHELATIGVALYADGNGWGAGTPRHCSLLVAACLPPTAVQVAP